MHQQPPNTPLFASTSPANASQLDSSRALIAYLDLTSTQRRPPGHMALGWASDREYPEALPVASARWREGRQTQPAGGTVTAAGCCFSRIAALRRLRARAPVSSGSERVPGRAALCLLAP